MTDRAATIRDVEAVRKDLEGTINRLNQVLAGARAVDDRLAARLGAVERKLDELERRVTRLGNEVQAAPSVEVLGQQLGRRIGALETKVTGLERAIQQFARTLADTVRRVTTLGRG